MHVNRAIHHCAQLVLLKLYIIKKKKKKESKLDYETWFISAGGLWSLHYRTTKAGYTLLVREADLVLTDPKLSDYTT